ncbi:MAG: enoyl-CoA hydratase-related protein, partial [Acidimicrobiales bacterium]
MSEFVTTERRGTVLVITLDRPEVRNAVNRAVSLEMAEALDTLDAESDLVVGVITGAGGNFCSGMDLKAFAAGERPEIEGRG